MAERDCKSTQRGVRRRAAQGIGRASSESEMIDLQQFCSKDKERPHLMTPFTIGDFSYATNGHIIVRVRRLDGIDPPSKDLNADMPFRGLERALFTRPAFK